MGTLASDAPPGPITGTLTIVTNHPEVPQLEVPIGGYVRPQILATPSQVDFGTFPAHQARKGSVIITNYAQDPLTVTQVESDIPGLTTELEEQSEGRRFAIHLSLESKAPPGPLQGHLTITTDNPNHPKTVVSIQGVLE